MNPELLAQVERAIQARGATKEGREIRFTCPIHDDNSPSARWNSEKRAWYCDVCAIGGGMLDLARRLGIALPRLDRPGLTLNELADAKQVGLDTLRGWGVQDGIAGTERTKCVDVPYVSDQGEVIAIRKRLSLTGNPRFIWRRGDKPCLYGLWLVSNFDPKLPLILVEGESDSWTLWQTGFQALGVPGAGTWKEAWKVHLQRFASYVWREPDAGGDSLASRVASDLPNVRVIEAPIDAKDPSDLWQRCGAREEVFHERLDALMASARPASQLRTEALGTEARELFAQCRDLLEDPGLLDRIAEAIRRDGYAGDLSTPTLVYLTLTSRFLERPINLTVLAQSGAGKNRAVDAALVLVPDDAYYLEKAGSARALVYAAADFQHKIVIVSEADSIPEEGPAASAVRALAADNVMTYDVVEKDGSGQFVTRHIEKPGPTGLITTSTKQLGEQMSTRMLAVTVADTPGQTLAVLLAHADAVNGSKSDVDHGRYVALQRWLEIAGDHMVTIPYASVLARAVPVNQVRMRRDFRQLLTVIQTIALLHQRLRPRNSDGSVVADFEDYREARGLLLEVFSAAASGGVTRIVRETITAVRELRRTKDSVTAKEIGDKLGLAKETAWHRAKRCLDLGLLVNLETRKGQPAKFVIGDPLPDDRPALPTLEHLMQLCEDQPESDSTVQPAGEDEIQLESEPAVENSVECAIQPPIQPLSWTVPDSERAASVPPVERLNEDRGDADTRDTAEADRVYAFALAGALGYPQVQLRPGESVLPGEKSWQVFTNNAPADRITDALVAMEADSFAAGESQS